ncbi:2-keto-4-pentenoate hydratase [Kribbella sp. NPDC004875]|uniref:2-keto-4-pentenoate hydratase n=1 Tax=Kribbella sp. NPDC004875 TaxID=3364107 RepID=UPI0036C52804
MTSELTINLAADRLCEATNRSRPVAPVRDLLTGIDDAYRVQQELVRRRTTENARVVGRKIGLTSDAVQRQLGVDQPDYGVLFDDMAYVDGATVPTDRLLQPRIEAEVAFVLAEDLRGDIGPAEVRAAVAAVLPALEIVDSRIADWDITIVDTVADNGSSGLYVLGSEPRSLDQVEPKDVKMTMAIDGAVVSTGDGSACLGDPLAALLWLARLADRTGDPLRAGQVVLSGALGPMVPVALGNEIRAQIDPLGSVAVRIGVPACEAEGQP